MAAPLLLSVKFFRLIFNIVGFIMWSGNKFSYEDVIKSSSMEALLIEANKEIKWLIDGLVEDDRAVGHQWLITGEPKAGKSRLAMQMAIALAEGKEFIGFKVGQKSKVLYFNFEMTAANAGRRVSAFCDGDEFRVKSCGTTLNVVSCWTKVDVLNPGCEEYLKGFINKLNPDLVVWDVMRRMTHADENSNVEMSIVMQSIRDISCQRTHFIVHHSKKSNYPRNSGARGIRGASSIHGEVDGVISIAEVGKRHTLQFSVRSVPGLDEIRLRESGQVFLREESKVAVEKVKVDIRQIFGGDERLSRQDLHAAIIDVLGVAESAVDRRLNTLIAKGELRKEIEGRKVYYYLGECLVGK